MIPAIYAVSLLISVVVLVYVLEKRIIYDVYHLMLTVIIVLCNLGYLMLSISGSLEEAVLANKISYLGCFLPFFMFMIIAKICRIRIAKWISIPMAIYAVFIYACVLSIGYSDIYYSTLSLAVEYGGTILLRTYGPAHTLYNIMIFAYMAAAFVVVLVSYRRKTIVSHTTVLSLGVLMVATCAVFALQKLLPVPIELMPMMYAVCSIVVVYWLQKSDMYDVSIGLIRVREQYNRTGYLIFDGKKRYCGADEAVKTIYPEVDGLFIDKMIPASSSPFYTTVVAWFYENAQNSNEPSKIIEIDDHFYKLSLLWIRQGQRNKLKGYLLEFSDVTGEQAYIRMIDRFNDTLEKDVQAKTANIREIQNKTIIGIAAIVESRDNSTGGHIRRTSDVVSIFADRLLESHEFSAGFLQSVIKAAPMHDLGKVSVDDRILRKQGKYTPEEYAEMQKHAAAGAAIIEQVFADIESPDFVEIATNVAHYHHEKWDGNGYPSKLTGQEIPAEARIMALADVFDALVSKRCYKESYSYDKAFDIIQDSLGTHFDPHLGLIFIDCRDRLTDYYEQKKAEGVEAGE